MNVIRRKWQGLPRGIVVVITALVIYIPLLFIVVQSFLSAPFFARSKEFSLGAFEFIFTDPDFYLALKSGFILAVGLVLWRFAAFLEVLLLGGAWSVLRFAQRSAAGHGT